MNPTLSVLQELRTYAATLSESDVHTFLREHYKADRFEGRNNSTWGTDFSHVVARSALQTLKDHGYALISHFESTSGEPVYYNARLQRISHDQWMSYVQNERTAQLPAAPLPSRPPSPPTRGRGR